MSNHLYFHSSSFLIFEPLDVAYFDVFKAECPKQIAGVEADDGFAAADTDVYSVVKVVCIESKKIL